MKKRKYIVRVFKCQECGMMNFATKMQSNMTGKKHIKDMYCSRCEKTTKHIQEGTL